MAAGTLSIRPSVCFEIQKITAVSIGEGNQTNYQVQWAPTWISSVHLVGCEHLIKEFTCQQTEKGQIVDNDTTTTTHRIAMRHLQNDLSGDVLEELLALPHKQQLTDDICKQGAVVAKNVHVSQKSNYTEGNMNLTVDKDMRNLSSQINETFEGDETNLNFEWVERSIGGINIDNIGINVSNDKPVDIDTAAANVREDDDGFASHDLQPLHNFSTDNVECRMSNVDAFLDTFEVKREEIMVTETNLTDPNTLNEDGRSKDKTLSKISEKYECSICHKVLKSNLGLSQHSSNTHGSRRKCECDICGKKCGSEARLLQHKRKHARQSLSYKCSYCDKVCHQKHMLTEHLKRAHTDERPFSCKFCIATFKRKGHLERHVRHNHLT